MSLSLRMNGPHPKPFSPRRRASKVAVTRIILYPVSQTSLTVLYGLRKGPQQWSMDRIVGVAGDYDRLSTDFGGT
jgi:hypothetical protein